MTQFEFVTVFISIVVAFGLSDVLASLGEQIRLRHRIRHYALHSAWSGLLLIVMMQVWWSLWVSHQRPEWTFLEYLSLMMPYLTIALIAYIHTPKFDDDDRDIKRYYFDNSRWFFSLAAVYLAFWTVFSYVALGNPINEPGSLSRFAGMLLMIALAVWKNERFHMAAVALAYILLAVWIAVTVYEF